MDGWTRGWIGGWMDEFYVSVTPPITYMSLKTNIAVRWRVIEIFVQLEILTWTSTSN